MSERDPRLSPLKGDVISLGGRRITVKRRVGNHLDLIADDGHSISTVKHWRRFTAKAQVIHRADQGDMSK